MIPDFISPVIGFIPFVLLVSIRVGTALVFLPPPFSAISPRQVRAILALAIGLLVAIPHPELAAHIDPTNLLSLGRDAVGEILVGTVIGLTVRVTLAAAEVAGSAAGFSMGLGFAMALDPTSGEQAVPITRGLTALATVLFLLMGGHHTVIRSLAASLTLAPTGDAFGIMASAGITRIGSSLLAQGLRIAAPVIASMFILKLGIALMAKAAPRVNVFTLSFAISIAGGMFIIVVASPTIVDAIASEIHRLPDYLNHAMGGQ